MELYYSDVQTVSICIDLIGYIAAAIFKLLLGLAFGVAILVGACACIQTLALGKGADGFLLAGVACSSILLAVLSIFCLGELIWITVDWIRILTDGFLDGKDQLLKSW